MQQILSADTVLLLAFCPILVAVALSDMKNLRIPNTMVMAGLCLFIICSPLLGVFETSMRAAIGGLAFIICSGLFAFRVLGGGDAKMIPVVFLFIPSHLASIYMVIFGWSLLLGIVFIHLARKGFGNEQSGWVFLRAHADFPMGISIAMSGFIFLAYAASLSP